MLAPRYHSAYGGPGTSARMMVVWWRLAAYLRPTSPVAVYSGLGKHSLVPSTAANISRGNRRQQHIRATMALGTILLAPPD